MNQRRETRFEANQQVWITLFGEPDIRLPALVKNVSPRGIGLQLQGPVAIGAALKFELDDALFLGEVIYCREEETSFYVGVELEQALYGLAALARTAGDLADSPLSARQPAEPVKNRRYQG